MVSHYGSMKRILTTGICGNSNFLFGGDAARSSTCAGNSLDSVILICSEAFDETDINKVLLIHNASEGLHVLRVHRCNGDILQHTDMGAKRSPFHVGCMGGRFHEHEAFHS